MRIVISLIIILTLGMVVKNMKTPVGLGLDKGRLAPMPPSPNAVSSQSDDPEKRVDPISFKDDLRESKEWIKQALLAYGGIKILRKEENYIHAVSTSSKMKFHDDLEFYFDEKAGLIQFRSASRVGYSDRGLNRERYKRIIAILNK